MLPTGGVLIPVFERLFQVKLDGIDELVVTIPDHHLIATKIGSGQELESFRHAIELQSMILPHAKNSALFRIVLPDARLRIVDAFENRVLRINYANKAILILGQAIAAALMLFAAVKS